MDFFLKKPENKLYFDTKQRNSFKILYKVLQMQIIYIIGKGYIRENVHIPQPIWSTGHHLSIITALPIFKGSYL